jgi:hypothetical protein
VVVGIEAVSVVEMTDRSAEDGCLAVLGLYRSTLLLPSLIVVW